MKSQSSLWTREKEPACNGGASLTTKTRSNECSTTTKSNIWCHSALPALLTKHSSHAGSGALIPHTPPSRAWPADLLVKQRAWRCELPSRPADRSTHEDLFKDNRHHSAKALRIPSPRCKCSRSRVHGTNGRGYVPSTTSSTFSSSLSMLQETAVTAPRLRLLFLPPMWRRLGTVTWQPGTPFFTCHTFRGHFIIFARKYSGFKTSRLLLKIRNLNELTLIKKNHKSK